MISLRLYYNTTTREQQILKDPAWTEGIVYPVMSMVLFKRFPMGLLAFVGVLTNKTIIRYESVSKLNSSQPLCKTAQMSICNLPDVPTTSTLHKHVITSC